MSNYPQYLLTYPIAADGDKTIPPTTAQAAGTGRLSQKEGWRDVNEMPISEGGIPPDRMDFNGAFYLLSQFLMWYQQGGVMQYNATLDYEANNEVFYNGVKYRCIQANGASTSPVAPGTNPLVWKNMDHNVPAGAVVPFFNVQMGSGDNARNPIFWGETQPDESWVICDGGSDGHGGNVPNLTGRFLKGSAVSSAGTTGGSASQTLQQNQIPAHTHTITISEAGGHTHTRGTMNITGALPVDDHKIRWLEGAFYQNGSYANCDNQDSDNRSPKAQFDASRSWTGETSNSGTHTHTATCSTTGGATSAISTEPPFYQLAFFVKLPEA